MKRLLTASFLLCLALFATAQQKDYYHKVQGLKKSELKTALFNLIQPTSVPKYGGKGEGYTWWGFTLTDRMPDGTVRDRYSANQYKFDGLEAVNGMNIEHSFANSWWGHIVNNAYCDLFNLYPSDSEANGRKSNNPIGVVDGAVAYDNGVTRVGRSSSYRPDSLITVWEPADNWKGDFARTFFYMATCYEDYTDLWQTTEGLLMVEKNRYPTLRPWIATLLMQWNRQDPVDDIERERNANVQQIQGNRNPFIDYPQLADYIWGDSTSYRFYTSKDAVPELFVPDAAEGLHFNEQSVLRGFQNSFVLRGRGATDDLRLSSYNKYLTLARTDATPAELEEGVQIAISANPTQPGTLESFIEITGGGISAQIPVSIPFVAGLPLFPAKDITSTVNACGFTASWPAWGDGVTYTIDVYLSDTEHASGYPKVVEGTEEIVRGLKGGKSYKYCVTASDGTKSDIKEVQIPVAEPLFTTSKSQLTFTTVPDRPSRAQSLGITLIGVSKYETHIEAPAPFEVSADGVTWTQSLNVYGSSNDIFVRLGAVLAEGHIESEMILTCKGGTGQSAEYEALVTLFADVDASKAFFENFESGTKNAYADATVEASAATWRLANALLGTDANDGKNDKRSVRIRVQKDTPNEVTMLDDCPTGCDSLWFWAGPYGKDTGVKLSVFYSTDQSGTWLPIDEDIALTAASWQRFGYELKIERPLRLKFVGSGTNGKRISLDDIQMSGKASETAIHTPNAVSADDIVRLCTPSGILLREGRRADVLKGLPDGIYIISTNQ